MRPRQWGLDPDRHRQAAPGRPLRPGGKRRRRVPDAWIDNHEAWQASTGLRLRTTSVASTTTAPQVTKHYYANSLVGAGGQRIATRVDDGVGDKLYYVLDDPSGHSTLFADGSTGEGLGYILYDVIGSVVTNTLLWVWCLVWVLKHQLRRGLTTTFHSSRNCLETFDPWSKLGETNERRHSGLYGDY